MDYAIEYALMSELYDERCLNYLPATEGVAWDKIKGFFKRIWDWIVKKVGDLIAKLKKKPAPAPAPSGPLLLTTSKNEKYRNNTGRDANGNPYTRVASDNDHARERISNANDYTGKMYAFVKQITQMALHINRLANDCYETVTEIEKHVINSSSNSNSRVKNVAIIHEHKIPGMDKNAEELDAYITGLNEIKAECIEEGLQMQMHEVALKVLDKERKDVMASNLSVFKREAKKMSMYMDKIDLYDGVKISGNFVANDERTKLEYDTADIIRKASVHIQSSLVILEKAVVALNSL